MANFTNHRNRRSIRLKGYDYAQAGSYYITICVQDRLCLFGEVRNGEMMLNDAGKTIETVWFELKSRFPHIYLHEHITMPNHFHGILEIITSGNGQPQDMGQPQGIAPTMQNVRVPLVGTQNNKTVGDIMDAFKSITTVAYIRGVKNKGWQPFNRKLWQRNYYEHIIRDGNDYNRIANYIKDNPMNWEQDDLYL